MSANPNNLLRRSQFRTPKSSEPIVLRPHRPSTLRDILKPDSRYLPPFRPVGANTSVTDCDSSNGGTQIDVTALDKIKYIDQAALTVTAQAGVRIGDLAAELAAYGLELAGGHDLTDRTLGGAVAGACAGPAFGVDGGLFSSQVRSIRIVSPMGKPIEVQQDENNLLNAFRLSYGMLGVIYEVTMNVRPIRPFVASHRKFTFEQFAGIAEILSGVDVGLKCYLLPFCDRIYADIRRYNKAAGKTRRLPWRFKEWGESTVLPRLFRSLNRFVPVPGVRERLIDEISQVTHGLVNNRLVTTGSFSAAMLASARDSHASQDLKYSTWYFPAAEFAIVVKAYRDFCRRIRAGSKYRCDMPAVAFRVSRDRSAMLSPSFDEPMIALRAVSTNAEGWEDFAIDFGEFARGWGGVPVFNQTRDIPTDYPRQVFGSRLSFFKRVRQQLDPEDRMMNVFLSQYFL